MGLTEDRCWIPAEKYPPDKIDNVSFNVLSKVRSYKNFAWLHLIRNALGLVTPDIERIEKKPFPVTIRFSSLIIFIQNFTWERQI